MPDSLQALFEAIRGECSASIWSRGVELARAEAVSGESDDGEEVALRVSTRGGLISPSVHLFPDDEDWDCDCGTREAVCEHVAAGVIALRRARSAGEALPKPASGAGGRIGYRLARTPKGLEFERAVVGEEGEETLTSTLAAISSGRVEGPSFVATQDDLAVERVLGSQRRGVLPRGIWPGLLGTLAGCPDVRLDGEPIQASAERIGYVGRVEDDGDGFVLRIARDPRIVDTFAEELVLLDDGRLCPSGDSQLTGRERESFGRGAFFAADDAALLVSEVLPSLAKRLPLEVKSDRLPRATSEPPRLVLELGRDGEALTVLPTLVYGEPPTARVDGGKLVPLGGALPLRDEAAERSLSHRLQQDLELLPGRRVSVRGEEAVALAERVRRFPAERRGIDLTSFRRAPALVPALQAKGRSFVLSFTSEEDGASERRADPERVMRAWRSGESLVPLLGGGFAELPSDWLARYGPRIADLLAARDERGEVAASALPDLADLFEDLDLPVPSEVDAVRASLAALAAPPTAPLPADLEASLRDYQQDGVDWLCALRDADAGGLLADDMGLGKTLQALCALRGRSLVVAPTSVVHNWASEARKFRPEAPVPRLPRSVAEARPGGRPHAHDLRAPAPRRRRAGGPGLGRGRARRVAGDQEPGEPGGPGCVPPARTLPPGAHRHAGREPARRAVEPAPLRAAAACWAGAATSTRATAKPIAAGDAGAAGPAARTHPTLRAAPHEGATWRRSCRRAPRSCCTPSSRRPSASSTTRSAPPRAATWSQDWRPAARCSQALEALLRLRQAACHPALVPGQSAEGSAKLELLCEQLEEIVAEGHKALVFSQWTSLLDLVGPRLDQAGITASRLDGATRDRGAVVDAFQADDGPPVLLISLKAGGTGLNLTAADHVFILDPWWNPAAEDQAADRAHRIGQERPVLVTRLVARDTVEERILALQASKRQLAQAALEDAGPGASLSREELLELLA